MAGSKLTFKGGRMSSNDCLNEIAFGTGGGGGTSDASAANQTLQITQETATNTVLGTTAGTAVITDAAGTIQQYLRGLVALIVAKISVKVDQTTPGTTNAVALAQVGSTTTAAGNGVVGAGVQRVAVASDNTPFPVKTDQTTHGTTDLVAADITKVAGAAISQGHGTAATAVRVELPTDGTGVVGLNAGSAVVGKVGIDQTTPGTTNATQPKQRTATPSGFAVATADATVFTLTTGQKGLIQNLHATLPLFVKLGASATTSSFSFILPCGAATDDGRGGMVEIDDWTGAVSVASTGGTGRFMAWSVAP